MRYTRPSSVIVYGILLVLALALAAIAHGQSAVRLEPAFHTYWQMNPDVRKRCGRITAPAWYYGNPKEGYGAYISQWTEWCTLQAHVTVQFAHPLHPYIEHSR